MAGRNPLDRLPAGAKARLRKIAQPRWVVPMLATLTHEPFSREGWLFEPKWDGERCLVFRRGRDLSLFSREPEAAEQQIPRDHGSVRSAGNQALHRRRRNRHVRRWNHQLREAATTYSDRAPVGRSSPQGPGAALSFDLLYLDHYDTRQIPLQYRKDVLRDTFDFQDPLQFTEQREREGEAYDRQACRRVGRA